MTNFNALQVIWNFDQEELKLLFEYKKKCSAAIDEENIREAYINLRGLLREIDAKLQEKERKELDEDFKDINSQVEIFSNDKTIDNYQKLIVFIEQTYIKLNRLMKEHGIYFREGRDASKAVLRQ